MPGVRINSRACGLRPLHNTARLRGKFLLAGNVCERVQSARSGWMYLFDSFWTVATVPIWMQTNAGLPSGMKATSGLSVMATGARGRQIGS